MEHKHNRWWKHKKKQARAGMARNTLWMSVFVKIECKKIWMLGLDFKTKWIEGKMQVIEGKTQGTHAAYKKVF